MTGSTCNIANPGNISSAILVGTLNLSVTVAFPKQGVLGKSAVRVVPLKFVVKQTITFPTALAPAQANLVLDSRNALRFNLPQAAHVSIRLYDTDGRLAANALNENRAAGDHVWALPETLKPGVYLVRFRSGGSDKSLKVAFKGRE